MTVETNKSKTAKQVMGSLTYDFDFECLLQDPTEDKAKEAIKVTISDGDVEQELTYGTDYSVSLNSDGFGGTITLKDAKDKNHTLVIYREYDLVQGSEYQDYNAFPAKTVEGNMDKNLMIAQQHQEQIDRCVKMGITSNIDPEVVVSEVERVHASIDNVDIVASSIANVNTVAGNNTAVNTVANNISNVKTVSGIDKNVTTVANISGNVTTVATNVSDVNTVAGSIANVNTVAADKANIDIVAEDQANIDAVVANKTNIDAVKNNATNINSVAANSSNINAVNANKTNIDTIAANMANVQSVANISGNVTTVATNVSDVNTVAGSIANVNTVAADKANIDIVAEDKANIDAVVANKTNIDAVKNNATNINSVAANMASVKSVAADLKNIDSASTYASNANVWAEGTDAQVQALGGVHSSKGWADVSAQGQIQADWLQTDSSEKDYIKNKPTNLSDFTDDSTKTPIARAKSDASGNVITTTYATKTEAAAIIPTLLQNYGRPDFIHAKLLNTAYEGKSFIEMWTDGATNVFDKTTLQIEPCVIKLTVDGVDRAWHNNATIEFAPAQNLDTGSSLGAGKNYYIYLVPNGTECKVIASLNASYPDGYTANNSRKIGWFHTLCVAAGTIAGHLATDYEAGAIIPNSVACLSFRPKCDPSGMAYIDIIDSWVDIYLQSGTGASTASVYGGTITDTRYYGNHCRDMAKVGKTLPASNEFSIFAFGSNEKTNIKGSADPVTTGGHVDTNSRRMISQYFIEDCCGALWQWLDDEGPCGGSNWTDITLDDMTSSSWYGSLYVLRAGGYWGNGAPCGGGCRHGNGGRSTLSDDLSARGLSRNISRSII